MFRYNGLLRMKSYGYHGRRWTPHRVCMHATLDAHITRRNRSHHAARSSRRTRTSPWALAVLVDGTYNLHHREHCFIGTTSTQVTDSKLLNPGATLHKETFGMRYSMASAQYGDQLVSICLPNHIRQDLPHDGPVMHGGFLLHID